LNKKHKKSAASSPGFLCIGVPLASLGQNMAKWLRNLWITVTK